MSTEKIDFDKVESEIRAALGNTDPAGNESKGAGTDKTDPDFDVFAIVFEIEKMGNAWLKSRHESLPFKESEIKLHAKMLSDVLQRHISADILRNSPEIALLAYSVVMGAQLYRKFEAVK